MSRSPYFFVERYDEYTGKYELQHPIVWNHDRTKQIMADLFPYNGCHDLFSIVENNSLNFPTMKGIHGGLPKDVCKEIKESYEGCSYDSEWGGGSQHITPNARWFTYADMYIYYLENPTMIDYGYEDEVDESKKIIMPIPLKTLMDRVDAFLEVMDGWDWKNDYSLIRIVYWIL